MAGDIKGIVWQVSKSVFNGNMVREGIEVDWRVERWGGGICWTKKISVNERCLVSSVCVCLCNDGVRNRQRSHGGDDGVSACIWWRRPEGIWYAAVSPDCLHFVLLWHFIYCHWPRITSSAPSTALYSSYWSIGAVDCIYVCIKTYLWMGEKKQWLAKNFITGIFIIIDVPSSHPGKITFSQAT